MRAWGTLFGLVLVAAAWTPTQADAAIPKLVPDRTDVHVGEPVTVTGDFCPAGRTVALTVWIEGEYPKALAAPFPLDATTVGLVQTADGLTFHYTHPTERNTVWFIATCDDASTATSEGAKVTVWPPADQLWFSSYYGQVGGGPGYLSTVEVASLDCVEGSEASLILLHGNTTIADATATVTAGHMVFELAVPGDATAGTDLVRVTCTRIGGGQIVDTQEFTVFGDGSTTTAGGIPGAGSTTTLVPVATVLLLLGTALTLARRHT